MKNNVFCYSRFAVALMVCAVTQLQAASTTSTGSAVTDLATQLAQVRIREAERFAASQTAASSALAHAAAPDLAPEPEAVAAPPAVPADGAPADAGMIDIALEDEQTNLFTINHNYQRACLMPESPLYDSMCTRLLSRLQAKITAYQAPFRAALDEARAIVSAGPEVVALRFRDADERLKMAIRIMARFMIDENLSSGLDDSGIEMTRILRKMLTVNILDFKNIPASPLRHTIVQMIIDFFTTIIDNDTTRGEILVIHRLGDSNTNPVIVSSRLKRLNLSRNRITRLNGLVLPQAYMLDLFRCDLTTLDGLSIPKLQHLDIRTNKLSEAEIARFLSMHGKRIYKLYPWHQYPDDAPTHSSQCILQ